MRLTTAARLVCTLPAALDKSQPPPLRLVLVTTAQRTPTTSDFYISTSDCS